MPTLEKRFTLDQAAKAVHVSSAKIRADYHAGRVPVSGLHDCLGRRRTTFLTTTNLEEYRGQIADEAAGHRAEADAAARTEKRGEDEVAFSTVVVQAEKLLHRNGLRFEGQVVPIADGDAS